MVKFNRRNWVFSTGLGLAAGALATQAVQAANAKPTVPGMQVEAVQMPAWLIQNGKRQPLSPGDSMQAADEIETSSQAGAVVRLAEGSLISLGEKTRLGIQRLEVNAGDGRSALNSDLKLFTGFFRFATSAVAKVVGQRRINVSLRTSTIGIRGTDFWAMTDELHDAACLFEGRIEVATSDQGTLELDKPTAFWSRFFSQAAKPIGNASPQELATFLKSTELQPGTGVALRGGRWRVVALADKSEINAKKLQARLRELGYPAQMKAKLAKGAALHEVRINSLATREDAQAILTRIAAVEGVNGRVALSA